MHLIEFVSRILKASTKDWKNLWACGTGSACPKSVGIPVAHISGVCSVHLCSATLYRMGKVHK